MVSVRREMVVRLGWLKNLAVTNKMDQEISVCRGVVKQRSDLDVGGGTRHTVSGLELGGGAGLAPHDAKLLLLLLRERHHGAPAAVEPSESPCQPPEILFLEAGGPSEKLFFLKPNLNQI